MKNLNVIRFSDFEIFGCPICGHNKGQEPAKGPNWTEFLCEQCNTKSFLLGEGLIETPFEIGDPPVKLAVVHHPRNGTLAHFKKITDRQELENILYDFEKSMAFDTKSIYIKLRKSKQVTILEENFPHVINAIGKYIKETIVSPNPHISIIDEEWLALVPLILLGKINSEEIPDPMKTSIEELQEWCINFKYEP